jgi:outer membrane protein assembly factor BamB
MNSDGHLYVGTGYDESGLRFGQVVKASFGATTTTGWSVSTSTPVWSPPAIMNGVVYATTFDSLYAIRSGDGAVLWHAALAPLHTSPLGAPIAVPSVNGAANSATMFVTEPSGTRVWAVDANTGALRWTYRDTSSHPHGATISNNRLLVTATDAIGNPRLVSLNATTGAVGYVTSLPLPVGASAGTMYEPATANGVVVVDDGSAAWALRAGDGAVLARMALAGPVSAHPTMSEGLIFFPVLEGIDVWGVS